MGNYHPQSFYDRAKLLATVHPLNTVAELIGTKPSCVTRMKSRGWIAPGMSKRLRPVPTDFCIQYPRMKIHELMVHYKAGQRTVTRWRNEMIAAGKLRPYDRDARRDAIAKVRGQA